MVNLVEVRGGELSCDSQLVAKKFGIKHSEMTKTISKLISDIDNLRGGATPPYFEKEKRIYRGNSFTAFVMGREFFTLLCMRLRGDKALEWQMRFNSAFYAMESALLKQSENGENSEWLKVRVQSKAIRLQQTDVIKDFVEYATDQGSKSAKFYYKHYTNATYKALGLIQHKKPKLRDTLDCMEISQLMVAENVAKTSIKKHMIAGEHYKAVFVLVKQDLEAFAKAALLT